MRPSLMDVLSSLVRGCIVAPRGKKLVVADLAGIEGRSAAWLAGEEWKVEAYRAFDRGEGADLYKLAYAKAFGIPVDAVTKDNRQIGKVLELACQYQGRVGAFITFSLAYGIDLEALAESARPTIPADTLSEAEDFHDWWESQKRSTFGLSRRAFSVCDSFVRLWRVAHPAICRTWRELEDACVGAVDYPGKTFPCGKLKVRRDGAWLRIALPSGRALCYPQPKIEDGKLTYMGVNQYTRQWQRIKTYGGKGFENVCQGFARDVLAGSMPGVEAAGYSIALTVHDEIICEAPDSPEYSAEGLAEIMATPPEWAPDIPLAAAGFEAYRYRKG